MRPGKPSSSITEVLRRAVAECGVSYKALSRETGVARASIQRSVDGRQSLRLGVADRLAAYFEITAVSKPADRRPFGQS
jgi:plasmid maintenance system antidote protein VapI